MFKNCFDFLVPSALAKKYILYKIKNKNKNNALVQLIKSRWSDLKDKIKEMSEDEKKKKMNNQIKDLDNFCILYTDQKN